MDFEKADIAIIIAAASALFTGTNALIGVMNFRRTGRRVRFVGEPDVRRVNDQSLIGLNVLNLSAQPERVVRIELSHAKYRLTIPLEDTLPAESESTIHIPAAPILEAWREGKFVLSIANNQPQGVTLTVVTAPANRHRKRFGWNEWDQLIRRLV